MRDNSNLYVLVRDALIKSTTESELESADALAFKEEEHTPTPSPSFPITFAEFENTLHELVDNQKWSSAITLVQRYKHAAQISASNQNLSVFSYANIESRLNYDELSVILSAYSQRVIEDQNGCTTIRLNK